MNRFLLQLFAGPSLDGLSDLSATEHARLCRVKRDIEQKIARTLKRAQASREAALSPYRPHNALIPNKYGRSYSKSFSTG
jgi:hypothetical protein